MSESLARLPLVAHVVYRFDYGGLENGVVNLINATQGQGFRHCVIALTEATEFRDRVTVAGVGIHELGKRSGKDFAAYLRFYRLVRRLRPTVLHTRNIGTLDCAVLGRLAGVSQCIHGEHGWDVHDIDGTNPKYRRMRRFASRFIRQFITVSDDLSQWLTRSAGIVPKKITRICNGVDTSRFTPRRANSRHDKLAAIFPEDSVIVGSVLRFQEIKDPMNLVNAFISSRRRALEIGVDLRLVMIGDGPLRDRALQTLSDADLSKEAWLPGSRDDVPDLMRSFDLFVLGSRREGISNTLLEAMASGLPVIATNTGGNVELVRCGRTGTLVEPENSLRLADELLHYARDDEMRVRQGEAARRVAVADYSLVSMIQNYRSVYADAIAARAA